MGKIRLPEYTGRPASSDPERRHFEEVLGVKGGASPVGSSFWKGVRLCPRESGLAQRGLRKEGFLRGRVALDVGLIWHHCLEAYYGAVMAYQEAHPLTKRELLERDFGRYCITPQVAAEAAAWDALEPFRKEPGYEAFTETISNMLIGYFEFYRPRERFKVLAVEETLQYVAYPKSSREGKRAIYESFEYSTRLDTIVEDLNRGGMWILEHKSATALTDDLMSGYQLDLQVLGQVWCAERLVAECEGPLPAFKGAMINIATKSKRPSFARVEVSPSHDHLRMFEQSVAAQQKTLDLWDNLGYPKHLGACTGPARYFATCPYFDVCLGHPLDTVDDIIANPPFGFTADEPGTETEEH